MTSTPFSDEELSAASDGDLDPARAAELDADPAARARRDELAAAAAVVATPVPPLDPSTVDDLIAGAIDAPLAPAAPRRTTRGPAPWLVAAVVVVLVAVGLGLVWSGRNASQEDRASFNTVGNSITASDAADSGMASGGQASTEAAEVDGAAPTTTAPPFSDVPAAVALGDFATGDDLRAALAEAFPTAEPTPADEADAPTAAALQRCADQLEVTLQLEGSPARAGYATVDGRAVLVYEYEAPSFDDGSPTTVVAAVGRDACDQVAIFQR